MKKGKNMLMKQKKKFAWWKEIRYFKPHKFDSPDKPGSGKLNMKRKFMFTLDMIRFMVGVPMHENSGFRTAAYNKKIKGNPNSAHLRGWGADIRARNSRIRFLIFEAAVKLGVRRIGIAKTFIHLDMDPSLPQEVLWPY